MGNARPVQVKCWIAFLKSKNCQEAKGKKHAKWKSAIASLLLSVYFHRLHCLFPSLSHQFILHFLNGGNKRDGNRNVLCCFTEAQAAALRFLFFHFRKVFSLRFRIPCPFRSRICVKVAILSFAGIAQCFGNTDRCIYRTWISG